MSRTYFEEIAEQWDDIRSGFFPEAVRDEALAAAQVEVGRQAADVGAGSGFMTHALLSAGLSVIAVDPSPAMIEVMRAKYGDAQVEYRMGTAEALPLKTSEVDYAFANMMLHHAEDPVLAIHEMARALKPGGLLTITDLDSHTHQFLIDEHHDRWMGFARGDIAAWFSEAGLTAIEVVGAGCSCCATSSCGTCSSTISIFRASGRKPALNDGDGWLHL